MDSHFRTLERRSLRTALHVVLVTLAFALLIGLRTARSQQRFARPDTASLAPSASVSPSALPPSALPPSALPPSASRPPSASSLARAAAGRVVWFEGACDASGAVEVDAERLAVADDENDVIRVYDAKRGGPPLFQHDFSERLGRQGRAGAESDLEAGTRWGDRAVFLSSHGRTRKGALDRDRFVFFASELPRGAATPALFGKPYRTLLEDMLRDPKLARFGLEEAARRAPKEPGGLNLEGLAAAPDGSFWIGFRSPLPEGRALLVRLLNPGEVLGGRVARFSDPVQVDLAGLGVRGLTWFQSNLLILAGPNGPAGPFRLYRYDGAGRARALPEIDFADLNPEAFFSPDLGGPLMVLSDDGNQLIGGKRCKKLRDARLKRFRGMWLEPQRAK